MDKPFVNLGGMTELVAKLVNQKQEEILKEILRQILKREPTIEDAKDLTILYCTSFFLDGYDIAYKGVKVGYVRFNFGYNTDTLSTNYTATFTPTLL